MQMLGQVRHFSKDKRLILCADSALNLNSALKLMHKPIFNDKERKVGEVSEIFGPVKRPYFSIKPKHGLKAVNYVGKSLYINVGKYVSED